MNFGLLFENEQETDNKLTDFMKKIFFALCIAGLLASCQTEPKETPDTQETVQEDAPPLETFDSVIKEKGKPENFTRTNQKSTVAPNSPVIGEPGYPTSPQTKKVIEGFTTDMWEMAAYVRMALPEKERMDKNLENRGRWFKFSENGTFTGGKFDQTTDKGKWYYDPMGPLVYLDHENRRDEEFTIKMNSDLTTMIFIGTETFDESGVQAKMENTSDFPKPR